VTKSKECSVEVWLSLIAQAKAMGVEQLHFSGGEPCAYPGHVSLIEAASNKGLYTNLVTSGVPLTQPHCEQLAKAGLKHAQLSFQGPSAE
jgi:pyrroloquinoline quinone biosynthesis protein E